MSDTRSKLERAIQGIRDFLEGNYPNPRTYSKGRTGQDCPHGLYRWEHCESCDMEYLEGLLKELEG